MSASPVLHHPNLAPDAWLATLLERPVYRLSAPASAGDETLRDALNNPRVPGLFAYAKVPTRGIPVAQRLESIGFRLVDTRIGLEKARASGTVAANGFELRWAQPGDQEAAAAIGGRCFTYSRFHQDPWIPRALADRVKKEWVNNYFVGKRGDKMALAVVNGRVIGFLQLLGPTDRRLVIDLIGVDAGWQGLGVGTALIAWAESRSPEVERIAVGTQAANIPSLRLYEKAGFRILESEYVFHFHQPGAV